MKNLIFIMCMWMVISISAQQQQGIQFKEDSLHILIKKAQQEHKFVFVDCYTSWCGPCKMMDSKVFPNDTIGQFFNERFISVRIDMEKGEGPEIAKKYEVHCYPTFLFFDTSGTIVHRMSGAYPVKEFIKFGQSAFDTINRYQTFEKQFASGKMLASDFIKYVRMREATCLRSTDIIEQYEQSFSVADLNSRSAWQLLNSVITEKDSRLFQNLLADRKSFDVNYGSDSVDHIIERIYLSALYKSMGRNEPDTVTYFAMRDTVQSLNIPIAFKIIQKADVEFYWYAKNWDRFILAVIKYMQAYGQTEDFQTANNYAWTVYENTKDKDQLKIALGWARLSISISPHWFNTDTYATLLYAIGNLKEARTWAMISIMLGKDEKMDYSETEKLLEKICVDLESK